MQGRVLNFGRETFEKNLLKLDYYFRRLYYRNKHYRYKFLKKQKWEKRHEFFFLAFDWRHQYLVRGMKDT